MTAVGIVPSDTMGAGPCALATARAIVIALLLLGLLPAHAHAQRDTLVVTPTRITLEPGQRAAQVYLVNRGNAPITARISLVNRHMLEDGTLAEADSERPGAHFADSILQYAPRRVDLAAGQGQTVRVMATPPSGQPAEYRSHLWFRVEPPASGSRGHDDSNNADNENGIQIRLTPIYGITIPVIVRTGKLSASSSISDVAVEPSTGQERAPRVTFRLHREGERSVYGDVRIVHHPRDGSGKRLVGHIRGLAVYPPLSERHVSVPLDGLDAKALPPGKIRVRYVDHDNADRVMAEAVRTAP